MEIIKISNRRKDLLKFIEFPKKLYRDYPYFVPPLNQEELAALDFDKNPVFQHAEAEYYLALKNGKVVGRIAAIVNWKEVNELGKEQGRFGWFDFIDDYDVSAALLKKAEDFIISKGLKKIEGPVGFSNLDKAGLLTKGFDKLPTMVTLYNAPYYESHLLHYQYEVAKTWVEYEMHVPAEKPKRVAKFSAIIKERYELKIKEIKSKKDLLKIADSMFDLMDETYGKLSSYVPFQPEQIKHYKEKYIGFINTDFVTAVANKDDKLIAFAITMPSYSKALQKANGRIFPFGWYHFMQASKKNDAAAFYLIGIDPQYQNKGITALVFNEMFNTFQKYGIKYIETNPELIENKSIQLLWKDLKPTLHKTRKSYCKELS
ncbi:N-acetyltransferase domain-containing protein [Candidatus Ornithobacterium hominis]|uniref:GNAT family N-acetyltransferase n=1 Tax=Candidatus Ornithobacterium hominis TaxID=2497989 RepID=UPI0024BC5F97|nr:GNAT family N-acetyltransferase [Candidatus Ornithobacterium hominis]CAI9429459.1 N-acetyltransferase domain-containing protein [Candidatus Ornithobacterium hominis]